MATSHDYQPQTFLGPHHCQECEAFLWGLRKQGFRCEPCQRRICKACYKNRDVITAKCPVLEKQQRDLQEQAKKLEKQPSASMGVSKEGVELQEVYEWYRQYVKRDASGKVVVNNLPREWKAIFREAGVKPSDLKDPNTAIQLIKAMKEFLKKVEPQASASAETEDGQDVVHIVPIVFRAVALYSYQADSTHDVSFWKGDIIDVVQEPDETGWLVGRPVGVGYPPRRFAEGHDVSEVGTFPGNYVSRLPEVPAGAPPPPPASGPVEVNVVTRSNADDAEEGEEAEEGVKGSSGVEVSESDPAEDAVDVPSGDAAGEQSVEAKPAEEVPAQNGEKEGDASALQVPSVGEIRDSSENSSPQVNVVKSTNAPPPPTPPPPPAKKQNVIKNLKKSTQGTKVEATPRSAGPSDLLEQIRKGTALKHVEDKGEADIDDLDDEQRDDLLSIMKKVMLERRTAIATSQSGENDDEDDDWSDDE